MLQKIKSLSLERQLFLSFSAVSALLLMLSLGITLYFDIARQSQSIDSTISSTAAYVASMDGVAEMLANGYPTQEVTGSLDSLHQNFPGIDIIVVYDRNGLRFYHTSRLETGETFVAGEETAILSGSPPYITTGYGTHGNQRVAFHAVRDGSGSIIGFVTVAIFRADILQRSLNLVLLFSLVLGGMFGVALLLARGIVHLLKGSLRGHHPKELLDLYLQQDDLLNSIEDGLVATDLRGQVVFANDQARTLLQCGSTPLEGQPLTRFFPETGCIQVAHSGQAVHNRSCVIQERQILASEVPILWENGSQGVLNVFHDKTEMRKLSDELSGARYMLDTLRFFNHEFMNKLHIILGYLQTGESQKAVQFIMNTSLVTSQSIRETADCIRVSHLCALIIGKMMHAAELGILLTVTHDSFCREEDLLLSPEDYATILGNLLENAIDELSRSHSEVREIKLSMYCRPDCNLVVCEDTGGGIAPDILPHIWDKGFSSKGEGRGFGLYLISRLVDEHGGCIELETEPGVGTCFTLTFTREE